MPQRAMEPVSGDGRRFRGINAIRAAIILLVVMFHVQFRTDIEPRGIILPITGAVPASIDMFFVISGFLVYRPFAVALAEGRPVRVGDYLRNRALRILPLYYTVTLLTFGIQRLLAGTRDSSFFDLLRSLTFTGIYSGGGLPHVLTVAWTLDDEIAFYLLLPLLFVGLTVVVNSARRLRVASVLFAILTVASVAYLVFLHHVARDSLTNGAITFLASNLVGKFAPFGLGMLLANYHAVRPGHRMSTPKSLVLMLAGFVVVLLAEACVTLYPPVVDFVFGVGSAMIISAIIYSRSDSAQIAVLGWAPLAFLGEISFGIYLWHGPILKALGPLNLLPGSYLPALAVLYAGSAALATVTYFVIEQPALRRKRRWIATERAPAGG